MTSTLRTLTKNKELSFAGARALDKRARFLYGSATFDSNGDWDPTSGKCTGVSWGEDPVSCTIHLVEESSPDDTDANQLLSDLEKPTCVIDGTDSLQINTDVGNEVVADTYIVTADPSDTTYAKVVLGMDDSNGDLEIFVLEKTTGVYGSLPAGKSLISDLKEFSVPAAGTVLTEEQNFID